MDSKVANREQWKLEIEEWRKSGKSIAAWAKEKNISYHVMLYWKDKFTGKSASDSALPFIELKDRSVRRDSLKIEVDGCFIHIHRGFDPSLLKSCVGLLKGLAC